jgi:hypothetical protein
MWAMKDLNCVIITQRIIGHQKRSLIETVNL